MLPKYHIIIGAIASITIFFLFNLTLMQTLVIFLSSILIDIDHYLLFIIKEKNLSLKKAYNWFYERRKKWLTISKQEKEKYKRPFFILHGIEFWLLLSILANYINLIWFILIGISIHMILDFIEIIANKDPFYAKFSQTIVLIKNSNKKDFN